MAGPRSRRQGSSQASARVLNSSARWRGSPTDSEPMGRTLLCSLSFSCAWNDAYALERLLWSRAPPK